MVIVSTFEPVEIGNATSPLILQNYSKLPLPRGSSSRRELLFVATGTTQKNLAWNKNLLKAFPEMAAEKYIIKLHNYEWKIRFKDTYYGPYNTQDEAVEAAIDAAFAMGEIGIDAEVLVQDGEHPIKTEWTYPQDFNTFMR